MEQTQDTPVQNILYPEAEYRSFGQMLIEADPNLDEELGDQQVVDLYNSIKDKVPTVTLEALGQMVPQLVTKIRGNQLTPANPATQQDKLAALQSMRR